MPLLIAAFLNIYFKIYFFILPTINNIKATTTTIIITVVHIPALKIVPIASQLDNVATNENKAISNNG